VRKGDGDERKGERERAVVGSIVQWSSVSNNAMLLLCTVDLVPTNLSELNTLTLDAQPKWFHLGLALGIDETKLLTIEGSVERRFTAVLSLWLHMSSPQRSWERLVSALKQPTVGLADLAKGIEERLGLKVEPVVSEGANVIAASTATADSSAGQCYFIDSIL
jgi:hypothetical protein